MTRITIFHLILGKFLTCLGEKVNCVEILEFSRSRSCSDTEKVYRAEQNNILEAIRDKKKS